MTMSYHDANVRNSNWTVMRIGIFKLNGSRRLAEAGRADAHRSQVERQAMTTFRLLRQFERQSRCPMYSKALSVGLAREATRKLIDRIRMTGMTR
jgi:hypothetical protein